MTAAKQTNAGAARAGSLFPGRFDVIDSIARREFLKASAILAGAAAGGSTAIGSAAGAPVARPVAYEVDGRKFEGMIVHDDSVKTKRPVIFMQPDWKGVDASTVAMARTVAGADYVVLMADMFGVGYGGDQKTVAQLMAGMSVVHKDLPFTIACGRTALDALLAEANRLGIADATRTAAIGYCAGGGFLLEHARTGADFRAIVVLHVTNPNPVDAAAPSHIKGRVLAIHGTADPVTPMPMMYAFTEELTKAGTDWQLLTVGGVVHSFSDPASKTYSEKLTRESYVLMRDFFAQTA
jgi:dienelactone hydrolase